MKADETVTTIKDNPFKYTCYSSEERNWKILYDKLDVDAYKAPFKFLENIF